MNKPVYLFFLFTGILLMIFSCDGSKRSVKNVPVTDYFDSCQTANNIDFGDIITMGDPNDRFMISLPYSWDIRQAYTDSIYGIFASNFLSIPLPENEKMSLAIIGYASELSLKQYYSNELESLVKDEKTNVLETGTTILNDEVAYWIKFNNTYREQTIYQLVLYLKRDNLPEIYLVQSSAYNSDSQNNILCNLKRLMLSVEWGTK